MVYYQRITFWIICFIALSANGQNKAKTLSDRVILPVLALERRGDDRYIDSLTQLGLAQLRRIEYLPKSYQADTLRLYVYNHLAIAYRNKRKKVDSSLYYANQLIALARKNNNVKYQIKGYLSAEYYHHYLRTDFPAALSIEYAALALIEKTKKEQQQAWRFHLRLGEIYALLNDSTSAFKNLAIALAGLRRFPEATLSPVVDEVSILQTTGLLYKQMGQFHRAEQTLLSALEKINDTNKYKSNRVYLATDLGMLYEENGLPAKALSYFKVAEKYQTELKLMNGLTYTWGLMAIAEAQRNNTDEVILLARKVFEGRSMKVSRHKAYQALYMAYESRKDWERAYYYYRRFIALNDTLQSEKRVAESEGLTRKWELEKIVLQNEQARILRDSKLSALRKQQKIERLETAFLQEQLLEKNRKNEQKRSNELHRLQYKASQERLVQQNRIDLLNLNVANEQQLRLILIVFLSLLLFFISILLIQNRRIRKQQLLISGLNVNLESKILARTQELQTALQDQVFYRAKEAELQQRIAETEMAALRAQINPHFIFNCLNSIQFFTAQNDAGKASGYLTKFSRLIRLVLENSKSEKVTLENELETLQLYIGMEAMRFPDKLHYRIHLDDGIDADVVQIPPLLLQPFVENAIWHGLMHKEEGGTVSVRVDQPEQHRLHIEITDDGIGRQQASAYRSKSATKHKSFGMKITADRIELINQLYQTQTQVEVVDLTDQQGRATGTRVVIDIPV